MGRWTTVALKILSVPIQEDPDAFERAALELEPGLYRVSIRYRSVANVPARLQLMWEGKTFAREPVPAWRFGVRVKQSRCRAAEGRARPHARRRRPGGLPFGGRDG